VKFFIKTLFLLYKKKQKPINELKDPKAFLVISNTALGDTLLSTPAIKSLKKSFPNSKIIAILKSSYSPLFKNYKYIDEIIEYNGNVKGFFKTLFKLRKKNIDIALILHSNSPFDIWLSVLSGIKFILKHPTNTPLKKYLSFNFEKKDQHTIEDRLDLVRLIGGKKIYKTMEISPLNNEKFLNKYKKYKNYIGFQIGAADKYKMWPIEYFIQLAKKMKDEKILITGVQSEWELGEKIAKECPNVINMCGKCTIEELPYLIKQLKILVTNDTGTMHLSIALKVPTISLFSATSSKWIGPYQDMKIHKVIQKDGSFIRQLSKKERDDSAMRLIKVDEVYRKYKELNETV
jgi:ADP-heptose:LPS heptosyltransferase